MGRIDEVLSLSRLSEAGGGRELTGSPVWEDLLGISQ